MFKPLTPTRLDDFAHVLRSTGSGSSCWDIWPRLTGTEQRGRGLDEAYPRADRTRVHDEWAFYGTEALFKKAGFTKVRGILQVPKGWTPRVTMRATGRMPRT